MKQRGKAVRQLVALLSTAVAVGYWCSTAQGQLSPAQTVKSFELAEGLEAAVWASEPMLVNPTNIDIDSRGRVWVLEGANYRGVVTRPEGDRIVILEDTDHDGQADSQKVFAQDPALASPLGIAVLGNKVYVSLSPNIMVYTIDKSGDKPVGKPEVWMTGFEGANHDHGVHAVVFGPDGRFYFNAGNAGCEVTQPFKLGNGKNVVDSLGSDVPRGPMWRGATRPPGTPGYMEGMAFRCNPDGTGFETLGHNFRNNFELAPDSFGTVWQSDNDDDGNEGTRLNYVMEGGNFGYHGPQGHDWLRDQPAFPDQSPQEAQWHLRWPGVVPNMIHTGGGSPTGIAVYEGDLLPEPFRGALIHCDPGTNVVRAYKPKRTAQISAKKFSDVDAMQGPDREGAGYKVDVVDLIKGKDAWFRPSDVCVAPDGSLLIADWYDPGVGGHQTADQPKDEEPNWHTLRGRIYRVAPKGAKPSAPKLNLGSVDGQIAALKSPNVATRYLAFNSLKDGGAAAKKALLRMRATDPNPRFRARALWLLSRFPDAESNLGEGLKDEDLDVRIAALRASRLAGLDVTTKAIDQIATNQAPAYLRELALAMNYQPAEKSVPVLVKLANAFDGEDRWYLEALGIGAGGKEKQLLAAWEKDGTNTRGKAGELIRWRLKKELPPRANLDEKTHVVAGWWAVGPFDAAAGDPIETRYGPEASPAAIDPDAAFAGVDGKSIRWSRVAASPFDSPIAGLKWVDFRALCESQAARAEHVVGYFATTIVSPVDQPADLSIASNDGCQTWLNGKVVQRSKLKRPTRFGEDVTPVQLRRGDNVVLVKLFQITGPSNLVVALTGKTQKVADSDVAPGAASPVAATTPPTDTVATADVVTGFVSKDGSSLPPVAELTKLPGDAKAGEAVFSNAGGAKCIACHQIGTKGQMLGPPLTTIGQKLNKAQLYEAILTPSSGILMGYENWVVKTKKGAIVSGLKTSETPDGITIKDTAGKYYDLAVNDIAKQAKQKISIMPENLSQTMTQRELVDLVEYLAELKNK